MGEVCFSFCYTDLKWACSWKRKRLYKRHDGNFLFGSEIKKKVKLCSVTECIPICGGVGLFNQFSGLDVAVEGPSEIDLKEPGTLL